MNSSNLKDLIYKIGNHQNKSAFVDIFDYFAPRIIGYLVSSGTQKEIAEEITQEVLSTVWQKADTFNYKKANVNTWIFTIARNKRIDRLRKNENPEYNSVELIDALYSDNNQQNLDFEQKIIEIQSKLTEYEKKLIKMNFFEGKTHIIISRELEIPLGTVKSKIRNILTKMKNS